MKKSKGHLEIGLGVLLLLLAVVLHLRWFTHVGGLWRDEANGPALASLPTFGDIWKNLQYDAFPILWFSLLRLFVDLGFTADICWRVLGLVLGLSCLAMLFWNSRRLYGSVPLISLAMLGVHPTIIRWGNCTRAFGLGLLSFLILVPLIFRLAREQNRRTFAFAVAGALVAVHSHFYNAVMLFTICMGGVAVTARYRNWRGSVLVLSVGAISAASLLPYAGAISGIHSWNMLIKKTDMDLHWLLQRFSEALGEKSMVTVWGLLGLAGVGAALITLRSPKSSSPAEKDSALFGLASLAIGLPCYFLFLKSVGYFTNPWYYVSLMGLIAVSLEACFAGIAAKPWARWAAPSIALLVAAMSIAPAWKQVEIRCTNIDLIAHQLQSSAGPSDLVVVNPWESGATFERYYQGGLPWMTIPPIGFHKYQRFDLVKAMMTLPEPESALNPLFEKMAQTLSSGGKVWIIGDVALMQRGQTPSILPPAPNPRWGWLNLPYYQMWSEHLGFFIQQHALSADPVKVDCSQAVSVYENPPFVVVAGWHP